jgi:hypothetical protein
MRRAALTAAVAVVLGGGCSKPAVPTVVLDDWWNVDYAKQSCNDSTPANRTACEAGAVMEVREFERLLATEFASNSACQSVRLVQYEGPTDTRPEAVEAVSAKPSFLMLDYIPGTKQQRWTMATRAEHSAATEGSGDAREIAATVCVIVRQRGAEIVN